MNARSTTFLAAAKLAVLVAVTSLLYGQDSTASKALPTAQEVMDRYVKALGGRDAILKHKAMTVRGKFEISEKGPSLDRVVHYRDGKVLYEIELPTGRFQSGFDGVVAWQVHPKNGPSLAEGNQVKSQQRDADMHYPAHVLDYFSSMEVAEIAAFEGHTCYHLKGTNKWGILNEQFYDTSTGLLVGYKFNSAWRGGPGEEIEVFSGYKDFDGWLMPTRDTNKSTDGVQVQTTTSVTFDDVDDSMFALPDAVKTLLAKKTGG